MAKKAGQLALWTFEEEGLPGPLTAEDLPNQWLEFWPGLMFRGVCFEVCLQKEVRIRSHHCFFHLNFQKRGMLRFLCRELGADQLILGRRLSLQVLDLFSLQILPRSLA
jgi:hypothetical protein